DAAGIRAAAGTGDPRRESSDAPAFAGEVLGRSRRAGRPGVARAYAEPASEDRGIAGGAEPDRHGARRGLSVSREGGGVAKGPLRSGCVDRGGLKGYALAYANRYARGTPRQTVQERPKSGRAHSPRF